MVCTFYIIPPGPAPGARTRFAHIEDFLSDKAAGECRGEGAYATGERSAA
jgi:hypothetical protein